MKYKICILLEVTSVLPVSNFEEVNFVQGNSENIPY